jgi:hypothetical protein
MTADPAAHLIYVDGVTDVAFVRSGPASWTNVGEMHLRQRGGVLDLGVGGLTIANPAATSFPLDDEAGSE